MVGCSRSLLTSSLLFLALIHAGAPRAQAAMRLGPEEVVQAGGTDLVVSGYSVPVLVDWNNNGRLDLVVGEGGGVFTEAKIRIYLSTSASGAPQLSAFFYAQSEGADLTLPAAGCLGLFPRVVDWDRDDRKDLLVGSADGQVRIYLNTGTDADPTFDGGTLLECGPGAEKIVIDVGARATPSLVDWNNDARRDLIVGCLAGTIHVFINAGEDDAPDFLAGILVQDEGVDLLVPSLRSSPFIADLDADGKKDILSGNTEGQLLLYTNSGTDASPQFSGHALVAAEGTPIDLPGTPRSRPFACDWTGDGRLDVLLGAGDGLVHLYQGIADVIAVGESAHAAVVLGRPFPNPCNPATEIGFELAEAGPVQLSIHDSRGRRLQTLLSASLPAGRHSSLWRGTDAAGRRVAAGVYHVRLMAGGMTRQVSLTLIQ